MSLVVAGKIAWAILVVTWYVLRLPHERQARRTKLARNDRRGPEAIRLAISFTGLGIIPFAYAVSGWPRMAAYPPHPILFGFGLASAAAAIVLFRLTHKALGRMWSVSLQLKEGHSLVTEGVYRRLRHPMYSAFWLMAIAQGLLLPNWIAGPAGAVGFGILFFSRIGPEERMMEEAFGDRYRNYRARTWRVLPFVY